jgi:cell wall-associated NlpC family hydrolase
MGAISSRWGVTRPVTGVAPPATTPPVASTTPAALRGTAIVSAALRYLGAPYVWGGNTPSGWDCSGFVVYIYREVTGRTLPRTTQAQWAVGTPIARGALQAGDLVFFQNRSGAGITHVGIALGDGRFVHASSPRVGTVVSSLSESYYASRYAGARRP